jgi:hypothetical protein
MFKLQYLNVIRIVGTEESRQKLLSEGFIEVTQADVHDADNIKKTNRKPKE